MTPDLKADLPYRIRRNKVFRVAAWFAVMATISFLLLSKTRWYQIHHHRSARNALQRNLFVTKPNSVRAYLSLEAVFWFLNRNSTLEERMERMGHHSTRLLELGYLENRQFFIRPQPPGTNIVMGLQPYISQHELSQEAILTITDLTIGVSAPAEEMPKWEVIIGAYNSGSATNSASPPEK